MTRVAILWHMHQPFYRDLRTGEHILPWVRLHALKDYYGMVALLREFPQVRVTFNLVPSLLAQLEAYVAGTARERHLELGLKPAEQLTERERVFCAEEFFHAHHPRMIAPYPRYAELCAQRDELGSTRAAARWTVGDLRDLQVWHKLVWLDPYYLDGDPRVRGLIDKGRDFTEDDKHALAAIERELLGRVIPEYREAAARGQVELSTSPFYHPILPLLCDSDIYRRTHPQAPPLRERFQRPDDARLQLSRAIAHHQALFGSKPAGLWPSEGSVSDDMVELVAEAGLRWMATDEDILARSLGRSISRDAEGHLLDPGLLYQPYRVGRGTRAVSTLFRDHAMSDLVGFTYASWPADLAAADFVRRLEQAGRRHRESTGREAVIPVVLDGENAWEYYEDGGRPFLRALYAALAEHPDLQAVTMSEAAGESGPPAQAAFEHVFPGSWINGDFYIWIGHADDRTAWGQVADARRTFDDVSATLSADARAQALEEILVAEGSDWFWWYGDDHSSAHDADFDALFRRHLSNAYLAMGVPPPLELSVTNITTAPARQAVTQPTGTLRPRLDGEVSSYFEWMGAGQVEFADPAGAMHSSIAHLSGLQFGFGAGTLYIRLDPADGAASTIIEAGRRLLLEFNGPSPGVVTLTRSTESARGQVQVTCSGGLKPGVASAAAAEIIEVAIPLDWLCATGTARLQLRVSLMSAEAIALDRYPRHAAIDLDLPHAG